MRVFQHHLYTCGCRSVVLLCREFFIFFSCSFFPFYFFATRTKSIDGSSRGACRRLNWHTRNTTKYIESLQHEFASQSILKGLAEDIFLLRLSLSLSGNPLENSRDVFYFFVVPLFPSFLFINCLRWLDATLQDAEEVRGKRERVF